MTRYLMGVLSEGASKGPRFEQTAPFDGHKFGGLPMNTTVDDNGSAESRRRRDVHAMHRTSESCSIVGDKRSLRKIVKNQRKNYLEEGAVFRRVDTIMSVKSDGSAAGGIHVAVNRCPTCEASGGEDLVGATESEDMIIRSSFRDLREKCRKHRNGDTVTTAHRIP